MLDKAARVFYVLAAVAAFACVVGLAGRLAGRDEFDAFFIADTAVSAVLSYLTAQGILKRRKWAKWVGYVFAFLLLLSFPLGTVIGALLLAYLLRASRAGLFDAAEPA